MTDEQRPHDPGAPAETAAHDPDADHRAIERLADELVPALVARLEANGLGELEIREGGWRLRLRAPLHAPEPAGPNLGRRASDRAERAARGQPAHPGRAAAPAAGEARVRPSSNGSQPQLSAVGPGHAGSAAGGGAPAGRVERRVVATSPAVGVFQAVREVSRGSRVRAGDRVALVDVLGVAAEVVAPVDAIVGQALVEPGEAVEYGQPLVELDRIGLDAGSSGPAGTPGPAGAGEG